MSHRQQDEVEEPESPIVGWLSEHYQGVSVAALAAFMLWVRLQSYGNFVRNDDVLFSGNDPYYHFREIQYTVRNWPATMPFDPWSYYPYGTSADQFGTLFDQVVATAALVVGLGSPSEQTVALTLAVAPAVVGALTVVPAYYAGRRLGGVYGGLFGALTLALLPGSFLSRSLVGVGDHHVAEAFAQMVAVLAFMVALGVAKEEKPIYELVVDRDVDALRRPVGWAALAGIATGLYVWTWPPAIMFVGVVGVFFAIKMAADYLNGSSPEPVGVVAVVSMTVAGALSLLPMSTIAFSPNQWGLLQPLAAFAIAGGAVFLAWLAREWDDRELDRRLYPVTIGGLVAVGAGLVAVLLPSLWSTLVVNFQRFIGFSAGAATRTIQEAQPFLSRVQPGIIDAQEVIMMEFGLVFFTALLALTVMLARPLFESEDRADHLTLVGGLATIVIVWEYQVGSIVLDLLSLGVPPVTVETAIVAVVILVAMLRGNHDGEHLFVAVWALFMTAAAFTQGRFTYYLALPVVVLNAWAVGRFLLWIDVVRPDGSITDEVEPYQMLVLLIVPIVVLPVLVAPITYHQQEIGQGQVQSFTTDNALTVGNTSRPGGITQWHDTLEWMSESTPEEGTYGDASNDLARYGTFEQTDDYSYESGTYGVMSWWDYGHWITVEGERIPNANPFQQGATHAANFLLSTDEDRATEILERGSEETEESRYVVIDSQMANPYGKFSAPTVFYDEEDAGFGDFVSPWHYFVPDQNQGGQAQRAYRLNEQRYYESMMVRLYRFNGGQATQTPVVINHEMRGENRVLEPVPGSNRTYRQFSSVDAAHQFMEENNDTTYTVGGLGSWTRDTVPAVEQYRLVRASEETTVSGPQDFPAYLTPTSNVKVFERVEGATVRGEGPSNETVMASVEMQLGSRNDSFTYTQETQTDQDGTFEMTLPYSTTGYDEWGTEEGYTNTSVRADGPYTISTNLIGENDSLYTYSTTANVSEAKVVGEEDSPVEVTLEREEVEIDQPDDNASDGNETDGADGRDDPDAPDANNTTVPENGTDGDATPTPGSAESVVAPRPADSEGAPAPSADASGSDEQAAPGLASGVAGASGTAGLADGSPAGSTDESPSTPGPLPSWAFVLLLAGALLIEVRDDGRH